MTSSALDDENEHVKELNRLFLSCTRNGDTRLDASGLHDLCIKLNLIAFSDLIIERIFRGGTFVDFNVFKDRFVQLLPDIIDVSGSAESVDSNAEKHLCELGVEVGGVFTRYEARILCKKTLELNSLQTVEVDQLFDQADINRVGQITLTQFLTQYKKYKRANEELNFITETFVPSVNLFETLDPLNTGLVDCQDLLEHWLACGINTEQGICVLKQCGHSPEGTINAVSLSANLERQLGDLAAAPTASAVVRVALLSLHAFTDHLRCCLQEAELRAEHFQKQLQLANQRHALLIEELEQSQLSMEQAYEQRIRELDERYRSKLSQMEVRYVQEKREIVTEVEKAEEEISRVRQNESRCRTRLQLVERQCTRLADEARELAETVHNLEKNNRHLHAELGSALQHRQQQQQQQTVSDDKGTPVIWRRRLELVLAHNKRLREKIEQLSSKNGKSKNHAQNALEPLYKQWSNAFRQQLLALKRRREARSNGTHSEMDSEPESIFMRAKKRRLLNVRERKKRHERVLQVRNYLSSGSSDDSNKNVKNGKLLIKLLQQELSHHKEQHQKEIAALKHSANKSLADALSSQQRQINQRLEEEREKFQIRLASERNALERKFVEEKMKMISRLQASFCIHLLLILRYHNHPQSLICISNIFFIVEFYEEYDCELTRLKSLMSQAENNDSHARFCFKWDKTKKSPKCSNCDQKRPKPRNFANLTFMNPEKSKVDSHSDKLCCDRIKDQHLCDDHRMKDKNGARIFQNNFPSQEKFVNNETKEKQLLGVVVSDCSVIESGFEDIISSVDSNLEEKTKNLAPESSCWSLPQHKLTEIRPPFVRQSLTRSTSGSGCSTTRVKNSACPDQCSSIKPDEVISVSKEFIEMEQLKADNELLRARLAESANLIKTLVNEYSDQLDKTSRLGQLIRSIYSTDDRS